MGGSYYDIRLVTGKTYTVLTSNLFPSLVTKACNSACEFQLVNK